MKTLPSVIPFVCFSVALLMAQGTDKKPERIDLSGIWRIRLNNANEFRIEVKEKPTELGIFCGTMDPPKDGKEASSSAVCVGVTEGNFNLLYGPAQKDGKPVPLVGCKTPYEGSDSIKGSCTGFGRTLPFEASRVSTLEQSAPGKNPKQ